MNPYSPPHLINQKEDYEGKLFLDTDKIKEVFMYRIPSSP